MLLTKEYQKVLEIEHATSIWGIAGGDIAPDVYKFIQKNNIKTMLDYGAGRSSLREWFKKHQPTAVDIREYEPGIPTLNTSPQPAELVVCLDVMEHVEKECVDTVLDHIQELAQKYVFFNISTRLADRILIDGRNAHITVMPDADWLVLLEKRWNNILYTPDFDCFTWVGETK